MDITKVVRGWFYNEVNLPYRIEKSIWSKWKFSASKRSTFSNRRKFYYELIRTRHIIKNILFDKHYVWGIDASLRGTGLTIIDLKTGYMMMDRYTTDRMSPFIDRTTNVMEWLTVKYQQFPPLFVCMEGTFFDMQKLTNASILLTKLNHAIEIALYGNGGCLYKSVPPMSIKKYITGIYSADKMLVKRTLERELGIVLSNLDISDSLAAAYIARDICNIIMTFPLEGYDVNKKKSMKTMMDNLLIFIQDEDRVDVLYKLLIGNTASMYSLSSMLPQIKRCSIVRSSPIFSRHDPTSKFPIPLKDKYIGL